MTGTAYKIVLRLLTPLHVGAGQLGNLQRARPYVTGKALWGALTARLTRDYPNFGGNYGEVGRRVNEELAFSYFYPAVGDTVDLWPWGEKADEFAWRYLGAYAGTALDYGRNAALEGSLHETEFIAPVTRDGQPVNLVGYIFERQDCTLPWQEALARLQIGGERTYGWGWVSRVSAKPVKERWDFSSPLFVFGCYAISSDDWPPVLRATPKAPLLAHALAVEFNGHKPVAGLCGPIEPLLGRETPADLQKGFGSYLPEARICWQPGCTIGQGQEVAIGEYGVWEKPS